MHSMLKDVIVRLFYIAIYTFVLREQFIYKNVSYISHSKLD